MDNIINKLDKLNIDNNKIIILQSYVRKFLINKELSKLKDNFDIKIIELLLDNYIEKIKLIKNINIKLDKRKIRNDNFPSEISENILKYVFYKKYKIMPNWNTIKGDLELFNGKILEVKAFSSDGPTSFGPNEKWNILYIVDCKRFMEKRFKVYEINLSNNNEIFKNIKINKNETYYEQCLQKRRPRIKFDILKKQLNNNINIIFDDIIDKLY